MCSSLSVHHFLEYGTRCHLPDALCESAFECFQQEQGGKQNIPRGISAHMWCAFYLYKQAREEAFCLSLREICSACQVSEKGLWKLFRKQRAGELLKSFVTTQDLYLKYSRILQLDAKERERIRDYMVRVSSQFQSFSPSTIFCLCVYLALNRSRRGPSRMAGRALRKKEKKEKGEEMSLRARLLFSDWAERPITARRLCVLCSVSPTCLFRIKKLWLAHEAETKGKKAEKVKASPGGESSAREKKEEEEAKDAFVRV